VGASFAGIYGELTDASRFNRENHFGWRAYCSIAVAGAGGKDKCESENGRRLRAAERTLHIRLRSIELVHRLHLHEWAIDAGTVLALLSAERPLPRAALLN
jgi:hypothetical protein